MAGWDAARSAICAAFSTRMPNISGLLTPRRELVAGSDAGSPGVVHGVALIDEIFHFLDAGLPMAAASEDRDITAATPVGFACGDIAPGNRAEFVTFDSRRSTIPSCYAPGPEELLET